MYQRVDFVSGGHDWVMLPMARHPYVLAIRQEMRASVIEAIGWHPEMDGTLSRHLMPYYRKIASVLTPTFEPEDLTLISRFRLFIHSEPVQHPELGEVPGLAQLDQMLGFSYETKKGTPPLITSGDSIVDLLADMLLVFKSDTQWLIDRYDVGMLSKLTVQACQRQDPELQRQKQREVDRKVFEQANVQQALRAHYAKLGIPTPDDF